MKILSISDVITNSSSEVFCYITGEKEVLHEVYETLNDIFGWNQELEVTPVVEIGERHRHKQIVIELPYRVRNKGSYEYFRGAIKGLLEYEDFKDCKVEFVN